MPGDSVDVTTALRDAAAGDTAAADRLWAVVYDELRKIARRELRREHRHQTLSTTGLVHEAYFKFVDQSTVTIHDRRHFYALACRAMRQILVDRARYHNAQKRAGDQDNVALHSGNAAHDRDTDLVALDDALERLSAYNERLGQIVECHFFGGLSLKETADVLDTPLRTVEREWSRAKAYLRRLLAPELATD